MKPLKFDAGMYFSHKTEDGLWIITANCQDSIYYRKVSKIDDEGQVFSGHFEKCSEEDFTKIFKKSKIKPKTYG